MFNLFGGKKKKRPTKKRPAKRRPANSSGKKPPNGNGPKASAQQSKRPSKPPNKPPPKAKARKPKRQKITASNLTQGHIRYLLDKAKNDKGPGLWRERQAYNNPGLLYKRWRLFNLVTGNSTLDNWMWSGMYAFAPVIFITMASTVIWDNVNVGGVFLLSALLVGLPVFYWYFVRKMWWEVYSKGLVLERVNYRPRLLKIVIPRLPFYHRPEVFFGKDGKTGYGDKDSYICLQMYDGQNIQDFTKASDFYDLEVMPLPNNTFVLSNLYTWYHLCDSAGRFYDEHGSGKIKDWKDIIVGFLPWLIPIFVFIVSLVIIQ